MKWHRVFSWTLLVMAGIFLLVALGCFLIPASMKGMGAFLFISFFLGATGWIVGDF